MPGFARAKARTDKALYANASPHGPERHDVGTQGCRNQCRPRTTPSVDHRATTRHRKSVLRRFITHYIRALALALCPKPATILLPPALRHHHGTSEALQRHTTTTHRPLTDKLLTMRTPKVHSPHPMYMLVSDGFGHLLSGAWIDFVFRSQALGGSITSQIPLERHSHPQLGNMDGWPIGI